MKSPYVPSLRPSAKLFASRFSVLLLFSDGPRSGSACLLAELLELALLRSRGWRHH